MNLTQPSSSLPTNKPRNRRDIIRRELTQKKHAAVRERFKELSALRIEGLKPSYSSIVEKLGESFFMDTKTIEKILKTL